MRVLVMIAFAAAAMSGIARADAADPLAAIARHADADVAALRAQLPGDATVRCTLGAVYAARGDLARASLYLEPCRDAPLADDVAAAVARARRDVQRKLAASELSGIDVITDPEGAWAEVDALPGDRFVTPQMIWVPAGHHVVTATSAAGVTASNSVDTRPHAQGPLMIALAAPAPPAVHAGHEDLSEDTAGDTQEAPPPDIKHPSIMPCHYVDGCLSEVPPIEDPLAARRAPQRARYRLGARFGGGVFDHSGADARLGIAAGAALSVPLTPRLAFAARLDWSQRGGTTMAVHGVDELGLTAGGEVIFARLAALDAVAGAGPEVSVALDHTAATEPATLAAAGWVALRLRHAPLVIGVRGLTGLTRFAPGARDAAALLELGVDLP